MRARGRRETIREMRFKRMVGERETERERQRGREKERQ
jgi:hypothetical protein